MVIKFGIAWQNLRSALVGQNEGFGTEEERKLGYGILPSNQMNSPWSNHLSLKKCLEMRKTFITVQCAVEYVISPTTPSSMPPRHVLDSPLKSCVWRKNSTWCANRQVCRPRPWCTASVGRTLFVPLQLYKLLGTLRTLRVRLKNLTAEWPLRSYSTVLQ